MTEIEKPKIEQNRTRVINERYEIVGMESGRMIKQFIVWLPFRFGSLAKGPGIGNLCEMMIRHRFGQLIAIITVKHESNWMRLVRTGRLARHHLGVFFAGIKRKLLGK